jgi:DNA-binding beta-propeller fold protein YncE
VNGAADSPAASSAAPKLTRLVLKIADLTKRRLKARATDLGITVAAYVVRLARADGVDVAELSPSGVTLGTFAAGTEPEGIAFDGTNMWVGNFGSNNVTKLSPAGATLATFALSGNPEGLAFDGTHMWVNIISNASVTEL